jgi:Ca2+:H+ antiporter
LLVLGLSLVLGGLKYKEQQFNQGTIVFHTSTLFIAAFIIAIPTILILGNLMGSNNNAYYSFNVQIMSDSFALLLIIVYAFGLVFTLRTHPHLFAAVTQKPTTNSTMKTATTKKENVQNDDITDKNSRTKNDESNNITKKDIWSKKKSIGLLLVSMIGIAVVSEILVGSVEETIKHFNLGVLFVGAIIVGIAGNVPEHTTSVMLARKGKLDLSIGIAANSGSQVALFVLPVIIIAAMIISKPFFNGFCIHLNYCLYLFQ